MISVYYCIVPLYVALNKNVTCTHPKEKTKQNKNKECHRARDEESKRTTVENSRALFDA